MELIMFESLVEKKKEKERLKEIYEQGKMPNDDYINELKGVINAQNDVISVLEDIIEAHEELEEQYEAYIVGLGGKIEGLVEG